MTTDPAPILHCPYIIQEIDLSEPMKLLVRIDIVSPIPVSCMGSKSLANDMSIAGARAAICHNNSDMNEIEQQIRTILSRITTLPPNADANADLYLDLGVASFHALQLLQELEECFSVSIPDDQFVEATSLNKLTSMMTGLLNQHV